MVSSIAAFIDDHLSSKGTRSKEAQAAFELLGKAAGCEQLIEERSVKRAARRLGVRISTFRFLIDCRVKMDAELEDGVEVGALLKVSRQRRRDARDDDAECFEDWSHDPLVCRYDSTQTKGGMKVRRFGDAKVDGKVTFEEHERRTLPCSRVELCQRFLNSDVYKAFLARKGTAFSIDELSMSKPGGMQTPSLLRLPLLLPLSLPRMATDLTKLSV
eukprot:3104075-Prymnesium_polylepis.1